MKRATYRYKHAPAFAIAYAGRDALVLYCMPVEVLADNGNTAQVKFLQFHADGRKPGTVTKVKSKSLSYDN